jgi:hypothetical protein
MDSDARLLFHLKPGPAQLQSQGVFVHLLEKAIPKLGIDLLEERVKDLVCDVSMFEHVIRAPAFLM